MLRGILCAAVIALALGRLPSLLAQSTERVEFDVVSIKRSDPNLIAGGIRRLPDARWSSPEPTGSWGRS
jgi:hypothetical protein